WYDSVVAFARGMVTVVDHPCRQSVVPEMVGREHLTSAIALNSASFQRGGVTGPAIAGLLIAAVGSGPVFMINGVSFGFTIIALLMIRTSELNRTERVTGGKGRIREGVRYIGARADLVVLPIMAAST